jgi:hypothetical protein
MTYLATPGETIHGHYGKSFTKDPVRKVFSYAPTNVTCYLLISGSLSKILNKNLYCRFGEQPKTQVKKEKKERKKLIGPV